MFILLVFFMLASSFLDWRAIDLAAPAGGGAAAPGAEALMLRVHADGWLQLNDRPVALAALSPRLRQVANTRPDSRLLIRPGPDVTTPRAVDLLDRARPSGIQRVRFVTGGEARP